MNPVGEVHCHIIVLVSMLVDACQLCMFEFIPATDFNEF